MFIWSLHLYEFVEITTNDKETRSKLQNTYLCDQIRSHLL